MPDHKLYPSLIEELGSATEPLKTDAFNEGCPFCDEYDGDAVPQHAAKAHPEQWNSR